MSTMDYDRSEPHHIPIIVSIIVTVAVILASTVGLVYYFKSVLSSQENQNQINYGKTFDLRTLNEWETHYLNERNENKVPINDAITIIINRYNRPTR
jgi:hypothetical protein